MIRGLVSPNQARRGGGAILAPLLLLLLCIGLLPTSMAYAQSGGIGITGTFYNQDFQIPQGVEVSSPSIYVIVSNGSDREFQVKMSYEAPQGVEILLSEQEDFLLQPGGRQKIYTAVRVGEYAVPGEYEIRVIAEVRPSGGQGVAVITAAAQKATLVITGEAAWVDARVVSPDGDAVVAVVRLFRVVEGKASEVARSDTGTLEAKVAPGFFAVKAYVSGEELAEESFSIAADETKKIILTVKTVYFAAFGVVRYTHTETGELVFAQIVYQVGNLYQPMADVELILKVSLDGEALEEVPLLSLSELSLGDISGSRDYIPPQGWESGTYTFQAELYVGGELYTTSLEEELEVTAPPAALMVSWAVLGGIIGAVLVIIAVIASVMLVRRRRALRGLGQR